MSARNDTDPATRYFFLSYAHTAPLAGSEPEPTDYWVQRVFDDLSDAVRRAAGLGPDAPVGFFDGVLRAGADWKARAAKELGIAEVFVPFYSPRYFAMSWPGREWSCFAERRPADSRDELSAHIVPVLWAPLSVSAGPPGAPDPLSLVDDVPEYAENGLRALKMLNLYSEQYEAVVRQLAERIAEIATRRPLPRSRVSALDEVSSAFRYKGVEDDFVVAVAAPTRDTVPSGRADTWYGEESTDWRPFGEREQLRLADHAVTVAERLNFSTAVLGVDAAADEVASTPAVVLIDPWIAAPVEGGDSESLRNLRRLYAGEQSRHWALPLLVTNADDPETATRQRPLIERLTRILAEVGAAPAEASRHGSNVVTSIDDFAQVLPALVADAERRYLKYSPDFTNDLSDEGRPVLGGATASPDSEARERPDG